MSVESASLSELVDRKFKVTRLKDMLRKRGLSSSGLKHDLIRRLIETHPEDMKEAVKDLVVLKCSEQGEKLVEHFRTTEGEPPIRDDMSPTEKAKTLKRWALATEAGIVGGTAFEAARRSIKAILSALSAKEPSSELPKSFRNPHEYDAEYILIPGGQYRYSVTKKMETVQDMYFAKYPVTNKRYSRFIRYLEEREHGLLKILPKREFDRRMIELAPGIQGFTEYLGNTPNSWPEKLRSHAEKQLSEYGTMRRFTGDNQPVVGISWFAARAYCFWLSALEEAGTESASGGAGGLYRLPTDIEWEWAASGGKRRYPWAPDKGLPHKKLANYDQDVVKGATTPVGRYPGGATPRGLMDMAGNVEEWMESWYSEASEARPLRGGSWVYRENHLRCSHHSALHPTIDCFDCVGFRVVRSQP